MGSNEYGYLQWNKTANSFEIVRQGGPNLSFSASGVQSASVYATNVRDVYVDDSGTIGYFSSSERYKKISVA